MLSTFHSNPSMSSVALNILPWNGSVQSFRSYTERTAKVVEGGTMHTGRKLTSSTDHFSKAVIKAVDPNGGLCLLTRQRGDQTPLEHAHLLPRCENNREALMMSLEHAFGIGHRLLNIDDVMNLIILKRDWHYHFDAKRWLLLPTIEMVDRIKLNHKLGKDITEVYGDARIFKYRMVPIGPGRLQEMLRYPRPSPTGHEGPENRLTGEIFEFPYSTLPQLESHAQPHWAILNAGMKLEGRTDSEMISLYDEVAEAYGVDSTEAKRFIGVINGLNLEWRFAVPSQGFTSPGVETASSGPAIPGSEIVAPGLAAVDALSRNTGSIRTHKSIARNLLDNAKMATKRILKSPKRSASSPDAASSLGVPPPDRKRSRFGKD